MIRILEVLVSLLIVLLLAVVVAVFLPAHGHIERSVEVSSPLRQVYDSLNTFRRFPEWSALRRLHPRVQMNFRGPESGEGAEVVWTSDSPTIGDGDLTITSSTQDSEIRMAIDNQWSGINKAYTVTLTPTHSGRTVKITWAYDVDYGWNLLWRYAGLYIYGDPATHIQVSLNNVAAMLASFPNVDYKDQPISLTDVIEKPIFLVSTRAPRTLDAVAEATEAAMNQIEAALKKTGLSKAGPRMTVTTNWGDENYVFDVAVPVDATTFKIGDKELAITAPVIDEAENSATETSATSDQEVPPPEGPKSLKPGARDEDGYLVVDGNVRAVLWYQGKALVTDYTGNPAALPLLRRMEKAYAETHGYPYGEFDEGRFWDELISPPDTPEDQQAYKVYLPVQIAATDASGRILPDATSPSIPQGSPSANGSDAQPATGASTPPAEGGKPSGDDNSPPNGDGSDDSGGGTSQ
ncbi:MAG: SRPBCC family protein [Rhodanobacteraceae bacterium]